MSLSKKKIHYVYLLTNTMPIDSRVYYIGVRTCACAPELDNYFSSSKIIKKIIKNNGNSFNKKILKEFNTRQEAVEYEVYLHKYYNVANNNIFYNIVNQTTAKFDTTGFIFINGIKISSTDYKLSLEKHHRTGKITLQNSLGEKFYVDSGSDDYLNGILFGLTKGMMSVFDKDRKKYVTIPTNKYNKEIHKSRNKGKAPVIDEYGNRFLIDVTDSRYTTGKLMSVHKNKILCKDKNNKTLLISKEEFIKNNYVGINKHKVNGSNNPNAKKITIFDSNDKIINICIGNFKEICLENKYPINSLAKSYRENGYRIFSNKRTHPYMIKNGFEKFKGWYAIEN